MCGQARAIYMQLYIPARRSTGNPLGEYPTVVAMSLNIMVTYITDEWVNKYQTGSDFPIRTRLGQCVGVAPLGSTSHSTCTELFRLGLEP
jgi:hypothetical protein